MSMALRARLLPLAIAGALSACQAVGPDYHLPDQAVVNRPEAQQALLGAAAAPALEAAGTAPDAWWSLYDDAVLNALQQQALASNAQLRVASANLRRSAFVHEAVLHSGGLEKRADLAVARARISAESLLLTEQLPPFNIADGSLGATYDFDLFGRLARAAEASGAEVQASQAALDLARISVAAEVARQYVEICHSNHELEIARHSLQIQQRITEVAQRLADAGRGAAADVDRAQAQVELLRAGLPPLTARRQAASYALSALLGEVPGQLPEAVQRCHQAPQLAQAIPVGDGSALLRRRPDVRAAERRLAAATARIGVATAALYPQVQLGASIGAMGLLQNFGEAPTRSWSIGPLISWSFPAAGAHARVHATEAGADAALAEFDQTVLLALRDTQVALSAYVQGLQRRAALHRAVAAARRAAEQNRALYQGGRTPYLASLDAERTLAESEALAAEADNEVSLDQIKLFLMLGGGWASLRPPAEPAS